MKLPTTPFSGSRKPRPRRGGIYIAVLGAGMLVTLIGLTALAAVRVERVAHAGIADAQQARLHAQSAVELAAQWVAADPLWRLSRSSGVWTSTLEIDGTRITLEGIDPIDGNIANRTIDPLILRATAFRGGARQIVEARLEASGRPLNVLQTALYTQGELRTRSGYTLTAGGAPAATGGTLRNDGTIVGDAECVLSTGSGGITGKLTIVSLGRALPTSSTVTMYRDLAVPINPGTTMSRQLLTPDVNPWGSPSPDGVYVIQTSSDLTIRDCRIHGTLVIICPGRTVTIGGNVLIHNARADYPALIVDGDLEFQFSSQTSLSEAAAGVNFNPPAAPFEGLSNATMTDEFPSEIRGLVHAKGKLMIKGPARVRGVVIAEAGNVGNAVAVENDLEIIHDADLLTDPPMGYMQSVAMTIRPGSWRQVILP